MFCTVLNAVSIVARFAKHSSGIQNEVTELSTQNTSIWSLTAAAPSDSVFRVLCINWPLTYLLT